jgi:hypothetical protein
MKSMMAQSNRMDEGAELAASLIRRESKRGQFISQKEILDEFLGREILSAHDEALEDRLERILEKAIAEREDLRKLPGKEGIPRYYSSQWMSETYVRILVGREGDLLRLIAETVRENSRVYPRPVPITMFREMPFGLTEEEISDCLGRMAGQKEYEDIARSITSIGTIFLYSNSHLDPDCASSIAEWTEVGQLESP